MALRDWISNSGRVATATVATIATLTPEKHRTVATVATVSVANEEKKGEIAPLEASATLPRWCRADCSFTESVDLPGEGLVPGCLRVEPDHEQWTRLEWLKGCPRRSGGRAQSYRESYRRQPKKGN